MRYLLLMLIFLFTTIAQDKLQIDSINSIERAILFSDLKGSIQLLEKNIAAARTIGYEFGEAKGRQQLAVILQLNGKYDESLNNFLTAIRYFEKVNLENELAVSYGDLGYQIRRRDLDKAKQYMFKGLRLGERHQLGPKLVALYNNYSVLMEADSKLDSAIYYCRKGLDLNIQLKDTLGIPFSLTNLSIYYSQTGDFKSAKKYLKQSDYYRQFEEGNYGRLINAVNWGDLYNAMNKPDSAIFGYETVINSPDAFEHPRLVGYCYDQIALIYQKRNDFKNAYEHQLKYQVFKDSLLNFETNSKIAQLEIEFETEKKDKDIAQGKLELKQQQFYLFVSIGLIVILLVISLAIYRYQQFKRKRLQREMELERQVKKAEYEREMADEKLRISRELHDNIGSQLTLMIGSIDQLSYSLNDNQASSKIEKLAEFSRDILNELRQTIWAMKSENASLSTLILKLNESKQRLVDMLPDIKLTISNNCPDDIELSSVQMLNFYRISQEAIQNAVKHANCKHIEIRFDLSNGKLCLQIHDNGSGFDPDNVSAGEGLTNMKERCQQADGQFDIESTNQGTKISCQLN
ncbi:MAG: hypothetical protein KDD94_09295 [Calditrichaeota bacterium]|nr:hypothetical protein [Calditrichota bacterium]